VGDGLLRHMRLLHSSRQTREPSIEHGQVSPKVEIVRSFQIFGVCCGPPAPPKEGEEEEEEEDYTEEEENVGGFPVDFQEVNVNCGQRNGFRHVTRIINGQEASISEFPFMAALLNRDRQFCGGSLIDEIHVLTAAHCVAQ
jgi:hypothetical protein